MLSPGPGLDPGPGWVVCAYGSGLDPGWVMCACGSGGRVVLYCSPL